MNRGDAFSEYGLMFTVKENASESGEESEEQESVADVIEVFLAVADKDGSMGEYIYMGKLSEIAKNDGFTSEDVAEGHKLEDVIFNALDDNDGKIIRVLYALPCNLRLLIPAL